MAAAQPPDSFAKWWPGFQAAVARKDGEAVGKGAKFPMDWEDGTIRQIKTSADLISHFDTLFPLRRFARPWPRENR